MASEHHRTLPLLSQIPAIQSAPLARLIVSWWERELQIWLLRKSSRELYHAGGLDGDLDKNRTRLATILIKGEFNITSAAISRDGSLLVVTTSTDVKVFAIAMPSTPLKKEELKISKVSVPDAVASSGASAVRISPDGAWICLIKEGNRPMLVRVRNPTGVSGSKPSLDTRPWKLRRLSRTAQKLGRLDGQQSYERTITQIAFSADSRVLAVADLAGFVDTWLLDRPQLDGADASADALPSDPSDSSSSSEASDDEQETTAKGPWIRNPKAALLPRLPAAPVVLSFSKHTPNLGSGPMSSGIDDDYTLVAITTSWHVLAFHPLAGTLTPWSRRNPRSRLPEQLLATRDLAKGVLWQGSRLWIYGISFLFMLDLSVDCIPEPSALPQPGDVTTAKRNGIDLEMPPPRSVKRKRGNESGAGNKMTAKESLEPRHVKVLDRGGWRDRTEDDDVAMRDPGCSDSDDEEEGGEFSNRAGELERLRYKEAVADSDQTGQQQLVAGQVQRPRWFQTFKYRPMVGIVELGGDEAATARLNGAPKGVKKTAGAAADDDDHMETMDTASTLPRLEVALVERPLWDAEMQPRLFGENEWER